ncbi:MAG TPA: STAS domain-containing protein [Pyrinomonadaceae bacterium]|nr:STAS domain-containing protein [Pyrinomonadaceae bacterium]
MLNILERQSGNTTILDLEGDVIMGGGSAKLRQAVTDLIKADKTQVLLNFQKVRYIDSSGTGELVSVSESVDNAGGSLKLSNLSPKVEQVLTLSSLLPILDVYDDETSALNE